VLRLGGAAGVVGPALFAVAFIFGEPQLGEVRLGDDHVSA